MQKYRLYYVKTYKDGLSYGHDDFTSTIKLIDKKKELELDNNLVSINISIVDIENIEIIKSMREIYSKTYKE